MYIIEIPDQAGSRPTMTGLALLAADLLVIADHMGLPSPRFVALHGHVGQISLQLPPETASIDAVCVWASAYCAAIRSDPHEGNSGPEIWVETRFDFDGADVLVYAHIPAPVEEPTETAP